MIKYNIAIINTCTEVEGPFKRLCIWFQGCNKNCDGCCNKALQKIKPVHILTIDEVVGIIKDSKLKNNIEGVTLSGGEPLLQTHLLDLLIEIKKLNLGIIMFTGYKLNEIDKKIQNMCDVIIDGKFDKDLIDTRRALIGSTNQNINFLTQRYEKEKKWFYDKNKLIEEINVSNYIIFNGDKI